ncbi:putative peptidoglycan binding protein [Streptomyces sp. Ag109_O5-1]|uniref:peptidoglycan-binding domain-containing protein n=1 Tax=Streptomyces sp. Ag109_O5-1 TaxID=1938851 RepID=UPI000F503B72|nr:peptidoglycan-binding domain-containing protein [Streptomyces sp. Ag109_O5-1]RPE38929.1 putative peptidoglycan binding protein [Streptomyces sp. Ag109_O5-1]
MRAPTCLRKAAVISAATVALSGIATAAAGTANAVPGQGISSTALQSYSCSKAYYTGTAVTEYGDTGNRVIEAQCQLHWRGFLSSGQVDGIFGNNTYNAVLSFQKEFNRDCSGGLSVDGVVGTYTWGALRSPCPS